MAKGYCSVCAGFRSLNLDGTVHQHRPGGHGSQLCLGGGIPPAAGPTPVELQLQLQVQQTQQDLAVDLAARLQALETRHEQATGAKALAEADAVAARAELDAAQILVQELQVENQRLVALVAAAAGQLEYTNSDTAAPETAEERLVRKEQQLRQIQLENADLKAKLLPDSHQAAGMEEKLNQLWGALDGIERLKVQLSLGVGSSGAALGPGVIRVMSWNIKKLTLHEGEKATKSFRRMQMLAQTVATVAPSVLFVQEVQTGPGGTDAIETVLEQLQRLRPDHAYKAKLSQPVLKNSPSEVFAVIWSSARLGDEEPDVRTWAGPDDRPPFLNNDLQSGSGTARQLWTKVVTKGSRTFDRAPAFVLFNKHKLVFVTVHHALISSTDSSKCEAETFLLHDALRAIAAQPMEMIDGTHQRQYDVVLCGDLNETSSGKVGEKLWDSEGFFTKDFGKHALDSRTKFFGCFSRCMLKEWSTNLYNYGADHPQHNDDIWAAQDAFQVLRAGVTIPPEEVLDKIRTFPFTDEAKKTKSMSTDLFNAVASGLWSDHRPVYCDLRRLRHGAGGGAGSNGGGSENAQLTAAAGGGGSGAGAGGVGAL